MLTALLGCGSPALDQAARTPFADELARFAAARAGPARDADPTTSPHFSPDGVSIDADGTLWAWSSAHPEQRGFRWEAGWTPVGTRTGPLRTRRCVLAGAVTWCVGEREPGGVRAPGDPSLRVGLPARGGFRDLAVQGDRAYVLDAVTDEVVTLSFDGEVLARGPMPAAPLRIGPLGDDALWVLAGTGPTLSVLPLVDGVPGTPIGASLGVPARDAAYDPTTDRLWTVGPADRPVRRDRGILEGPGTEVLAWDRRSLLRPGAEPVERREPGCVDGTRVVIGSTGPVIACTGSDEVADADGVRRVGLAPSGLVWLGDTLAVADRHDDTVTLVGARPGVLVLDDRPRDTLEDLGERLLSSPAPWKDARATCLSCHWEGLADHRRHPGVAEVRFEQTRPFAGVVALDPLFTPGQAKSLDEAVEGLVRGLDDRRALPAHEPWWLEPRPVRTKAGGLLLDARTVREALVAALSAWPVEPGPLRGTLGPEVRARGLELFARDCARCHEPTLDARSRTRVPLEALGTRPVILAAPLFARAGPPPFTPRGNRVPPLWMLDRGGPFLSDGSARTLDELLRRTDPRGAAVHGHEGEPVLDGEERASLALLLLAL